MTKQNISLTFSLLMQSNGSNASIWSTSEMEQGINLLSVSRHSRPNPVYTLYITNYNGFSLILMCSVARVLCICYDSQNFIFFAYFNRVFNRLSNLMQCHLDFLRVSLPSNIKCHHLLTLMFTFRNKGASRCHRRTFLSKWFHKEPLTSEETFCFTKGSLWQKEGSSDYKKVRKR